MSDITLITGLASMFGCLCMFFVCAAQAVALFTAAQHDAAASEQPWEAHNRPHPARAAPRDWYGTARHRVAAA